MLHRSIAVVGAGPAGFYTAERMLRGLAAAGVSARVDMFEALPFPHGLARYGVAPDHPEVKNVTHKFDKLMLEPFPSSGSSSHGSSVAFFGNVLVGRDVSVPELRERYHAVVLATGADSDRRLGIPGEDQLENVLSARAMVGWYNGHPGLQHAFPRLHDVDTAVVVGVGNVALDIARILLSPIDRLQKTDVTEQALEHLRKSSVRRVILLGRRGLAHAAFSTKELREMLTEIPAKFAMHPASEVDAALDTWMKTSSRDGTPLSSLSSSSSSSPTTVTEPPRALRRTCDLLRKYVGTSTPSSALPASKEWEIQFFKAPVACVATDEFENKKDQKQKLGSVAVLDTKYIGSNGNTQPIEGSLNTIKAGLLVRSIGYKATPLEGVSFDAHRGIVPNESGRVIELLETDEGKKMTIVPNLYVAGWLKRGPTGVILSTMNDAFETADAVVADLVKSSSSSSSLQLEGAASLLRSRNVRVITAQDWMRLRDEEIQRGQAAGKAAVKWTNVDEALSWLDRAYSA